jgi:hypothetical protein
VVVVVLALTLGCDPTGNFYPQEGGGSGGANNPALVGAWRNVHLEGSYEDGNILRVTTTWTFAADADCDRYAETYSLIEDLTTTSLRACTWKTDGRILAIRYAGASDTVSYTFDFPTTRHDTLSLSGIRFAHVDP